MTEHKAVDSPPNLVDLIFNTYKMKDSSERSSLIAHTATVTRVDYNSLVPNSLAKQNLEEEFFYSINQPTTRTIGDTHDDSPRKVSTPIGSGFFSSLHNSTQKVCTLVEAGLDEEKRYDSAALIQEVKSTANWRCGFCLMSIATVICLLSAASIIIYYTFFLIPILYIDQLQLYHLPVSDRSVGFRITVVGVNQNIINVQLETAFFQITVVDKVGSNEYNLKTPIKQTFNETSEESVLLPLVSTKFSVEGIIPLDNLPAFPIISDLIVRDFFAHYVVQGQITIKIAGFRNTIILERTQQFRIP
ncbi:hypothetical protein AKO1_005148 [Acrasis kona]|uniref:Late embryogenesis abundant protein LEA-2 subgroup domain-containing protein n=1 Tax=Acrasis kona TaxID=1008807 RepID=A0AAW2Z4Y8_9EUKA